MKTVRGVVSIVAGLVYAALVIPVGTAVTLRLLSGVHWLWGAGIAGLCGGFAAGVGCTLLAYWGTRRMWPGLLLPLAVVMASLLLGWAMLRESPHPASLSLLVGFEAPTVLGALVGFIVVLLASGGIRRTRSS